MQVEFVIGPAGSGKTFRCLEQVRSALVDMLAPVNAEPADEMDEAAQVATIDAVLQGTSPVSEVLLAKRHEGP